MQKLKVEIEDAKKRQGALLRKTRQETQKLCKEKRCVGLLVVAGVMNWPRVSGCGGCGDAEAVQGEEVGLVITRPNCWHLLHGQSYLLDCWW